MLPAACFLGRWAALERRGWALHGRTWDAERGSWICVWTRGRATGGRRGGRHEPRH